MVVAIVHQEGSGSPLPGTRPAPRGGNLPTCSIIIVTSENLALELFFFKPAEDERDGGLGNSRAEELKIIGWLLKANPRLINARFHGFLYTATSGWLLALSRSFSVDGAFSAKLF